MTPCAELGGLQNQLDQAPGKSSVLPIGMMPLLFPIGMMSPVLPAGMMPPMRLVHPAFCTRLTFYMLPAALIQKPDDMIYSPLGQHILDYEPPRGFVISAFTTFDGSTDPYDHLLHYNQEMILNGYNDRLLCKVFPASLRGLALAWFHKLLCNSINSFNELWAAFISHYLCSV